MTFTPSTRTSPSVASYNLGIRFIIVDFPEPVLPMNATVSPCFTLKDISFSMYSSASGYLKETFLNSMVPVSLEFCFVPSFILCFVSRTSTILFDATLALGYRIKIIVNIINAITTCIAYAENTTISLNKFILSNMFASFIR